MARTRIKICGVRDIDTVKRVIEAGTDYFGLVFAEGSPRRVTIEQAKTIFDTAHESIEPVALFANQPLDFVRQVLDAIAFRIVQLHGDEDRDYVRALRDRDVFKAVPFEPDRIDAWRNPPENVTALLIDTPPQPGELAGGTGRAFDWSALAAIDRTGLPPIVLAGGITPDNVAEAVRTVRPWGVDVSSGVESSRGVKDPALIRAFCDAVQSR